jgi:hypothetical protein
MKEIIETFFKGLYVLTGLQSMRRNSAPLEPKTCSAFASLVTELGSLIKDWDTAAEDLFERDDYTVQLWRDKKSPRKVLVCLRQIRPGSYLPEFFVPVPAGRDTAEILDGVVRRISAEAIHEEHLSPTP